MRFERVAADGAVQRMRWVDVTPDSLTWEWLRSTDEGATFELVWRLGYTRR